MVQTSILFSRLVLAILFLFSVMSSSCLKNEDDTANGPKSKLVVANYAVNGNAIDISLNDQPVTSSPLEFGGSTGTVTSLYTPVSAGLQRWLVSKGGSALSERTIALGGDLSYSVFIFDSVRENAVDGNKVRMVQLTDDITPVDTMGRLRFLQFIPGEDSLVLRMVKDSINASTNERFMGNKGDAESDSDFGILLPPGIYKLSLVKKAGTLYERDGVVILPNKVYSLIAKGVSGGTGVYKESVDIWQHN